MNNFFLNEKEKCSGFLSLVYTVCAIHTLIKHNDKTQQERREKCEKEFEKTITIAEEKTTKYCNSMGKGGTFYADGYVKFSKQWTPKEIKECVLYEVEKQKCEICDEK